MVMPPAFDDRAGGLLARHERDGTLFTQPLQTNATLIREEWCELIRRLQILIGVSVEWPAFLHDPRRRTPRGPGHSTACSTAFAVSVSTTFRCTSSRC